MIKQIRELKSGKMLDELIALKFLKLKKPKVEKYDGQSPVALGWQVAKEDRLERWDYNCETKMYEVIEKFPRNYSTNISDAWIVVEKLIEMHPDRDIHLEHFRDKWSVGFCWFPSKSNKWGKWNGDMPDAEGETLPEAICKLALIVCGKEIDKRLL